MTKKLAPYTLLRNLYGKPVDYRPQWADHLSIVRTSTGLVYVAEPYQLYPEAFNDFAVLAAHGWLVQVDGQSKHNPGRTVRVCITTHNNTKELA